MVIYTLLVPWNLECIIKGLYYRCATRGNKDPVQSVQKLSWDAVRETRLWGVTDVSACFGFCWDAEVTVPPSVEYWTWSCLWMAQATHVVLRYSSILLRLTEDWDMGELDPQKHLAMENASFPWHFPNAKFIAGTCTFLYHVSSPFMASCTTTIVALP